MKCRPIRIQVYMIVIIGVEIGHISPRSLIPIPHDTLLPLSTATRQAILLPRQSLLTAAHRPSKNAPSNSSSIAGSVLRARSSLEFGRPKALSPNHLGFMDIAPPPRLPPTPPAHHLPTKRLGAKPHALRTHDPTAIVARQQHRRSAALLSTCTPVRREESQVQLLWC